MLIRRRVPAIRSPKKNWPRSVTKRKKRNVASRANDNVDKKRKSSLLTPPNRRSPPVTTTLHSLPALRRRLPPPRRRRPRLPLRPRRFLPRRINVPIPSNAFFINLSNESRPATPCPANTTDEQPRSTTAKSLSWNNTSALLSSLFFFFNPGRPVHGHRNDSLVHNNDSYFFSLSLLFFVSLSRFACLHR